MSAERETWQTPDGRRAVIDYDERGITEITREALRDLLIAAGLTEVTDDQTT